MWCILEKYYVNTKTHTQTKITGVRGITCWHKYKQATNVKIRATTISLIKQLVCVKKLIANFDNGCIVKVIINKTFASSSSSNERIFCFILYIYS